MDAMWLARNASMLAASKIPLCRGVPMKTENFECLLSGSRASYTRSDPSETGTGTALLCGFAGRTTEKPYSGTAYSCQLACTHPTVPDSRTRVTTSAMWETRMLDEPLTCIRGTSRPFRAVSCAEPSVSRQLGIRGHPAKYSRCSPSRASVSAYGNKYATCLQGQPRTGC